MLAYGALMWRSAILMGSSDRHCNSQVLGREAVKSDCRRHVKYCQVTWFPLMSLAPAVGSREECRAQVSSSLTDSRCSARLFMRSLRVKSSLRVLVFSAHALCLISYIKTRSPGRSNSWDKNASLFLRHENYSGMGFIWLDVWPDLCMVILIAFLRA